MIRKIRIIFGSLQPIRPLHKPMEQTQAFLASSELLT